MTERGLTVQRYHVVAVDGGVAHGRDRVCVVVGVETMRINALSRCGLRISHEPARPQRSLGAAES